MWCQRDPCRLLLVTFTTIVRHIGGRNDALRGTEKWVIVERLGTLGEAVDAWRAQEGDNRCMHEVWQLMENAALTVESFASVKVVINSTPEHAGPKLHPLPLDIAGPVYTK